jgi:ferric-dicitrate binding protein FerR (iron transport regulator)
MDAPIDLQYELKRRPLSIRDEAAEWLLRWHCGDLSAVDRFEYLEWLKTSPVHISEMLRACRLYSYLDSTKPLSLESEIKCSAQQSDHASDLIRTSGLRPRNREYVDMLWRRIATFAVILALGVGAITLAGRPLPEAPQVARALTLSVLAAANEEPERRIITAPIEVRADDAAGAED